MLERHRDYERKQRQAAYKPWQPKKQRHLVFKAVLFMALYMVAREAFPQNQMFDMNVEITEPFLGCLHQQDAVDVVESVKKGEQHFRMIAQIKIGQDVCRAVVWPVTYRERVYDFIDSDGKHFSVYRGEVGGRNIFIPTVGFVHNSI